MKLYRVKAAEPGSIDKMASVQIRSDSSIYNAGETAAFDVKVENVGSETMKNISIALDAPESFTVTGGETIDELALGETKTVTFQVTMPEDASCSIDKPAGRLYPVCNGHLPLRRRQRGYGNAGHRDGPGFQSA